MTRFLLVRLGLGLGAVALALPLTAAPATAIQDGAVESSNGAASGKQLNPAYVRVNSPGGDCSGTLIASQWVLTAAHCVHTFGNEVGVSKPLAASQMTVTFSATPNRAAKPAQPVTQIATMPGYAKEMHLGKYAADVALLRLASPVADIRPVGLAMSPIRSDGPFTTYGFGRTNPNDLRSTTSVVKKAGMVRLSNVSIARAMATCSGHLSKGRTGTPQKSDADAFVARGVDGRPTGGDSGGPAITAVPGGYVVAGVQSTISQAAYTASCSRLVSEPIYGATTAEYTRVDGMSPAGRFIWRTVPGALFYPADGASPRNITANHTLYSGQTLTSGTSLISSDFRSTLLMQSDGDLVLRRNGNISWSTRTGSNPGAVLVNEGNGAFSIIAPGNRKVWSSNTAGQRWGSALTIQDDANMVLYNSDRIALWQSGTMGQGNCGPGSTCTP